MLLMCGTEEQLETSMHPSESQLEQPVKKGTEQTWIATWATRARNGI